MSTLSRSEIESIARIYFGDLGLDAVAIATAIAFAESGGDPDAVGDNYPRWQAIDSPYRWDRGLMQINSIHGYDARALMNPEFNMSVARAIYNLQGWDAWTTYRNGAYLDFYQAVTTAEIPPPIKLLEGYVLITSAFYPSYSTRRSSIVPKEYRYEGGRRWAVYELLVGE